MKKYLSVFVSGLLLMALCACGGGKAKDFSPDSAKDLLSSGAFSETLTDIDLPVACALFGIDESAVTGGAVYGSTGATAETLAILTFSTADQAEAARKSVGCWLEDQTESLSDYLPLELPKLKDAVNEVRGASLFLAVCNDYAPVTEFLSK